MIERIFAHSKPAGFAACVASVFVEFRSKELSHEKRGWGWGGGGGGAGGGVKKRLQSNSWILKTAHLAFHA